jgi:outer membrane protein TolC
MIMLNPLVPVRSITLVLLFIALSSQGSVLFAQETLRLEDAVARSLQNNLGIRLARQQAEISAIGNAWGAAGALPQIGLSATGSNAVSDQSQNPTSFIQEKLESESINIGGQLNWVLFDGFGMFANKRALERLQEQAEGQAAIVIEQTASAIMQAYNNVLVQLALRDVLSAAMGVSRARLDWMEARQATGASSTFDRLQFDNALLTDSLAWLQQSANIKQATMALNRLMGETVESQWKFASTLNAPKSRNDFGELRSRVLSNATVIQNALVAQELAEAGVQQARARLSPNVSLTASQNEQSSRFEAGDLSGDGVTKNVSANLAVNFNLFNGGATRRAIQQAKMQVAMAEMQAEDQRREVDRLLQDAWSRWSSAEQTHLISIQLTENSIRSLEIAQERLTSGAINSLDFRKIQMQVLNLQQQQLQALNAWQSADIELQRLSGDWSIEAQLP